MPSQPPRPREARPSVFGLKSHFLSMGVPHPAFEEKPTKGSVCGVQQVWAALCWDTMPGLTGAEHSDQKASSTAQWLASVQATGTIFRHASPNQSTACISGWQEENIGDTWWVFGMLGSRREYTLDWVPVLDENTPWMGYISWLGHMSWMGIHPGWSSCPRWEYTLDGAHVLDGGHVLDGNTPWLRDMSWMGIHPLWGTSPG
ncbi:uncharacterized [Tachysurus ichikawai]